MEDLRSSRDDSSPGVRRILAVDDDPDLVHLLHRELEKAGFDVWTAGSAEEALTLVEQKGLPHLALVPLPGHTHGHAGVAVRAGERWLFDAGDAYFFHAEMDPAHPRCTPGLRFYQWMMEKDRGARLANQRRLRELNRGHSREVTIFCTSVTLS